jgi:hypothetical protein
MFPSPTIRYFGLTFSMVNMPHPSYYMYHNPTESCFRHLQILEFAQACGRLAQGIEDVQYSCRAKTLDELATDVEALSL